MPGLDLHLFAQPQPRRSTWQLFSTLTLFTIAWAATAWLWAHHRWAGALLAIPTAGLVVRLFIIQHDCGHGSFFSSVSMNETVGALLGVLTLTPYGYWRRTHALHHAHHGKLERREELGYFLTMTVREYKAATPSRRLGYRVFRHPLAFFAFGGVFQFVFKHRYPWDAPSDWRSEWRGVWATNIGVLLLWGCLAWLVGWQTVVAVQLMVAFWSGLFGVALFYVQHVFPDAYYAPEAEWSGEAVGLHGSSRLELPAVLAWFSGDIGLHHVHHSNPRVPNYRLREAHEATPELLAVRRLSFREALTCHRLKLYDEEAQRLVGFDAVRA